MQSELGGATASCQASGSVGNSRRHRAAARSLRSAPALVAPAPACPPCSRATASTSARPSPAPGLLRAGSSRPNRRRASSRSAGAMPGPAIRDLQAHRRPSATQPQRRSRRRPPAWRSALSIRLATACDSSSRWSVSGGAAAIDRRSSASPAFLEQRFVEFGDRRHQLGRIGRREAARAPIASDRLISSSTVSIRVTISVSVISPPSAASRCAGVGRRQRRLGARAQPRDRRAQVVRDAVGHRAAARPSAARSGRASR